MCRLNVLCFHNLSVFYGIHMQICVCGSRNIEINITIFLKNFTSFGFSSVVQLQKSYIFQVVSILLGRDATYKSGVLKLEIG